MKPEQLPPSPFIRDNAEFFAHGGYRILDVGCAYGRNALYLAKLGNQVLALNNNESEIEIARNQSATQGIAIEFEIADARTTFDFGLFDVVLCNEVLHQIPQVDRSKVIRNMQTVTKPGGVNLVSDYIGDNPKALRPFWLYDQYPAQKWERDYYEDLETVNTTSITAELISKAYLKAVKY